MLLYMLAGGGQWRLHNPGDHISHNSFVFIAQKIVNIYILIEKSYSKQLERNVVYISLNTLSHATSHDFLKITS